MAGFPLPPIWVWLLWLTLGVVLSLSGDPQSRLATMEWLAWLGAHRL